MIKTCRDTFLNDIKCKYYSLVKKFTDTLAYGKRDYHCMLMKAKLVKSYIRIIECYTPFTSTVTAAFSIAISKDTGTDTVTLVLDGVTVASYTGSGEAEDIVEDFFNEINDTSAIWEAEMDGDTLYVYSYSNTVDYTITNSLTSSSSLTTATITSLQGELETISDLWNCLSEEELEGIIDHAYQLLEATEARNTNCGCTN
jgi:hypothetical protein